MSYIVGLDLGQAVDYTAIVVLECHREDRSGAESSYQVRYIERLLGKPYPEIVTRVQTLMTQLPLKGEAKLVADATGCGRPVIDMLVQAHLNPTAVTIHGGDQMHREGRYIRAPKRDLVSALQIGLQTQRLKIAEQLPLAATLIQELLDFRLKIDPATAHDSYSAWREKDHDDLVLATALAVWFWEFQGRLRAHVWTVRW
jgi:hypothetical protein